MKSLIKFGMLVIAPCALMSCAAMKGPVLTGGLTAGGAALGHEMSDGSVGGTALGALAGYAGGEMLDAADKKENLQQYQGGYSKGRSDATKMLYWAQRDAQARKDGDSSLEHRFYQIPVPPHMTDDGVLVEPHNRVVEVVE